MSNYLADFSTEHDGLTFTSTEEELRLKKAFAEEILRRPQDAFAIGVRLFFGDASKALIAQRDWINDPIVLEFMQHAQTNGADALSYDGYCKLLLEETRGAQGELKLKYYKLIAEVSGWMNKESNTVIIDNTVHSNVMVVREMSTNPDAWENRCLDSQTKLVQEAKELNAAITIDEVVPSGQFS